MNEINTIITVKKPLRITFDSFLDESIMSQWIRGFQNIEIIRGEPRKQHSKYILSLIMDNKPVVVTHEITAIIDLKYLCLRMEHPDLITYSEINFSTDIHGHSQVHCLSKIMGKGLRIKVLMPIVKNIISQRQHRDYNVFRTLVESK